MVGGDGDQFDAEGSDLCVDRVGSGLALGAVAREAGVDAGRGLPGQLEGAQAAVAHQTGRLGHRHRQEGALQEDESARREVDVRDSVPTGLAVELYVPGQLRLDGMDPWHGGKLGTLWGHG